jgi:hypothetical protein
MIPLLVLLLVVATAGKPFLPTPAAVQNVCDQPGDQWRNTTVHVVDHVVQQNVTYATLQYQTMPGCLYRCSVSVTEKDVFMQVYDSFLAECGKNGCVYEGRVCYLTSLSPSPTDEL